MSSAIVYLVLIEQSMYLYSAAQLVHFTVDILI